MGRFTIFNPLIAIGDGFRAIFNYIRPGWEGKDGKLSYRRVFQYAYGIEVIHIANKPIIGDNHFKVLVLLLMTFLLIEGMIRVPEIIQLLNSRILGGSTPQNQPPDETTHG